MRLFRTVPALLLLAAVGACDHSLLDLQPVDEIAEEIAIIDVESADAALIGAYASLTSTSYYGGDYAMWSDLLSDDVEHTGTFGSFGEAHLLNVTASNGALTGIWNVAYSAIYRVNLLIQRVPGVDMSQADEDRILGQAYALRALHYANLVRAWGDVPLVLTPPASLAEAAQVSRAPAGQVYTQIESDLASAESRLAAAGITNEDRVFVTPGFIDALQARVSLFQEDWSAAEAAAREVIASGDYELANSYGSLFTAGGAPTAEDIFRVEFIATNANNFGYYYQYAGRFEIGATEAIHGLYTADDDRYAVTFDGTRSDGIQVVKFPTTAGTEDIHVIRFAEVKLILAEALAEQGGATNLAEAVGHLNDVRTRSVDDPYVFGVDLLTQQDVLDAIYLERRLELAFEGHRWFDLVRTARAPDALGSRFSPHEALWPIPVRELDVAENMTQNPGY